MATIYGKFPVLLPGLTESISRNGLKFTNGTIAYLPGKLDGAIRLAENHGDLFPPPSSRNTGNGFWELSFQAVEFTSAISKVKGMDVITLSKNFEAYGIIEQWETATLTFFQLADSDDTIKIPSSASVQNLSRYMKNRKIVSLGPTTSRAGLNVTWTTEIRSVTRRNFGNIDEVDLVIGLAATLA